MIENIATREALGHALPILGKSDPNLIVLDADLGGATRMKSFQEKCPQQFFQIGIAEANMIGIASGLSEYGFKVFLGSFGSFLTGRYDIIRCSLAYSNRPVVLVGTHVGLAIGKDGVTQMGLEDVSLMRALPNMNILNPATYDEAIQVITYLAKAKLDSPYYLRLGRQPVENIPLEFTFGKAYMVRDGSDIVVFSTGCILPDVMKAAQMVENKTPLSVRIVNVSTLKPIDANQIISLSTARYAFSVEDHSIVGGLGSAISEIYSDKLPKKLVRIGLNDVFPESGPPADLYHKYGLSAEKIAQRIIDVVD